MSQEFYVQHASGVCLRHKLIGEVSLAEAKRHALAWSGPLGARDSLLVVGATDCAFLDKAMNDRWTDWQRRSCSDCDRSFEIAAPEHVDDDCLYCGGRLVAHEQRRFFKILRRTEAGTLTSGFISERSPVHRTYRDAAGRNLEVPDALVFGDHGSALVCMPGDEHELWIIEGELARPMSRLFFVEDLDPDHTSWADPNSIEANVSGMVEETLTGVDPDHFAPGGTWLIRRARLLHKFRGKW